MKRRYRPKSSSRKSPPTTPRKIARLAEEQARLLQLPLSVEGLLLEAETISPSNSAATSPKLSASQNRA